MTNKEAVAVVLDVGPGMHQIYSDEQTLFQQSVLSINMILQRKLFSESKDEVTLILFGTDDTANELCSSNNMGAYRNVTVARPLGLVDWDLIKFIDHGLKPGHTPADFLDAVVVAIDHLYKSVQSKKGFTSKRVVLFSNLRHTFKNDQINDIIGSFKEAAIEFDVIGPNLDYEDGSMNDHGYQSNDFGLSNPKSEWQKTGETLLRCILSNGYVEGASYSLREALDALSHFQSRQVRSMPWKCLMEVGTDLKIPINLYLRVKETKAKCFKNVYAKNPDADLERLRTTHLNNDEETEVEKLDLVDGFRYGSTLVPFAQEDKEPMKITTEKCFKVLGFTKSENVKRHQTMGDSTWVCVAEKDDEAASIALSALVNALYETNMVVIVRRVYAANGSVKLGCLIPNIKKNYECLFYMELPFSEDLRQFTFGSLPVEELDASSSVPNKKYVATDDQLHVVDELIDSMDLSAAVRDVDENTTEAIKPKITFNPYLQRLYQCLQHRALNPAKPLPELLSIITAGVEVPSAITSKSRSIMEQMKQKYKLEAVNKNQIATGEGVFNANVVDIGQPAAKKMKLECDADFSGGLPRLLQQKVTDIGTTTPVEDFHALLEQIDEFSLETVFSLMQKRISDLIFDSFSTQSYPKALSCLKVLRIEAIKRRVVKIFNDFLVKLKTSFGAKHRTHFWQEIVEANITLVYSEECPSDATGAVSRDDANRFLQTNFAAVEKEINHPDATDNLLDEME